MDVTALSLEQAAALPLDADSARRYSPLGEQPWLLLENSGGLPEPERVALIHWLHRLPCPTLVIDHDDHADTNADINAACDVVLETEQDAAPLLRNIQAAPRAASLLVQLLRNSEKLALHSALAMESLTYATLQAGPEYGAWLAQHRAEAPVQPIDDGHAVLIERDGAHVELLLNRASIRNAINRELRDALNEAFDLIAADPSIATARVSARGKCFSVGGDLSEFGSVPDPVTGQLVRALALPARHLLAIHKPLHFHVHGACIGAGIELPAFASHLSAAPGSFFQLPELRFGLIPGAGGCVSIPRRIGRQRAAWLALSGKKINAQTALAWGLVDAIE